MLTIEDTAGVFTSQNNHPWYCSKQQFGDYLLSRAQGKNRKSSLLCAIPRAREGASFQNVLIEESAQVESAPSLVPSGVESKSSYNVHIPNVNSTQRFLEGLTDRGDVKLYCLSTVESSCPREFRVIQVRIRDWADTQSMKEISLQECGIIFRPMENTVCFGDRPEA